MFYKRNINAELEVLRLFEFNPLRDFFICCWPIQMLETVRITHKRRAGTLKKIVCPFISLLLK